jgi:hypothetical protein
VEAAIDVVVIVAARQERVSHEAVAYHPWRSARRL